MRKAEVCLHGIPAGVLENIEETKSYRFSYLEDYDGPAVSLTMPVSKKEYFFKDFPPFFDGLLPEGILLEGLLKQRKIDKYDYFSQIVAVGNDLVGAVTIREIK